MKKLTIFFCGTLALAACGNGIEKKANEKLMVAQAAYERGDYEEAKSQNCLWRREFLRSCRREQSL